MGEQASAYALPPVTVFPDATRPHPMPCLGAGARAEAGRLAAVLAAVPAFGTAALRASGLRAAARAAAGLVRALPAADALTDTDGLPVRSPVQGYFRVRTAALTAGQAAHQAAQVIHRGLADLCEVPLSGSDIVRETAAMRQVVVDLAGSEESPQGTGDRSGESGESAPAAPGTGPRWQEEMWLSRWITGHHVHVLFNVYATITLRQAVERLRGGAVREAIARIDRTTVYVQGFAAARAHAAALPSDFYNTTVRPTMVPTVVPVPLSGGMHVEYREYRDAIGELVEALPDAIEDLAPREPDLAFAREALLEADLIEAERHVCLVEPVVGAERSLIQPPATTDNAVSVLRLMRHVRAARIASLVRFGDHLVATAVQHRREGGDGAATPGRALE
ncbi:hypothetical protein ACQUSR_29905 [Streptomyces sp. P1-3]|uniref:hypothetical protein n=1 Tax=Streptomyces sp. P1-3 TaxID=3421658 RepID=UPI003D36DBB0